MCHQCCQTCSNIHLTFSAGLAIGTFQNIFSIEPSQLADVPTVLGESPQCMENRYLQR